MKILVVVHAFYPQLLSEIAEAVKNIGACEMVVTHSRDDVLPEVNRLFPKAKIVCCENVGYDIWPFLKVINSVCLNDYDYIVKLHTKRDMQDENGFSLNHVDLSGDRWRKELLSFVKDPQNWRRTIDLLERDQTVGMVAGLACILRRKDAPWGDTIRGFDKALVLAETLGIKVRNPQFVGGTMFIVRSAILKPLQGRYSAADFPVTRTHHTATLGHYLERVLGFASSTEKYRLTDPNDRIKLFRLRNDLLDVLAPLKDFLYREKTQQNGTKIIKLLKIPIWRIKAGYFSERKDNANCVFVKEHFNAFLEEWDYDKKKAWFVFEREKVEFLHPLGAYLDKVFDHFIYGLTAQNDYQSGPLPKAMSTRLVETLDERVLIVHSDLVYNLHLRFNEALDENLFTDFISRAYHDFGTCCKTLGIKVKAATK